MRDAFPGLQATRGLHAATQDARLVNSTHHASFSPAPLRTGSGARPGVNNRPPQPLAGRSIRYFAA